MKILTRTVWILSLVSLLMDVASEMLYPVMPIYLKQIGFSVMMIGVLEGVAEATAGLSKGYFGKLSDIKGVRLPFVKLGYGLSSLAKPMMAAFQWPLWILSARSLDRLGKGIRTGARDAMLSDEATPETKGRVFSFHRGMDTMGAVLGPMFALVFLYLHPGNFQLGTSIIDPIRLLFIIAFFPSVAGISLLWLVHEKQHQPQVNKNGYSFFAFVRYLKQSPVAYKRLFAGLVAFALFNSSDMFILLMAKASGLSDTQVLAVYIFYNLVYALSSYPMGILADRIGLKHIFLLGLVLFAIVYAGMAFSPTLYFYAGLIFLYGIYAASTEGIGKAWISNIADKKDTATAIGTFSAFSSLATMVSSALSGFIWYQFGAPTMFITSAVGTLLVVGYFLITKE